LNRQRSLERRLMVRLALVGATGAVFLLLFVAMEYGLTPTTFIDHDEFPLVVHELTDHVVVPFLALIIPMTLAGRWVIRSALRPLARKAKQIDEASAHQRGFRVDLARLPSEVLPFASAVNALLDRLDATARDQEAFAADVAHELRTPLTVMALEIERLDHPASARLKGDVGQMRHLIDQLMILAQLDSAPSLPSASAVALGEIAEDVASLMAPIAIREQRIIAVEVAEPARVVVQREAVAAAVRNLVENALRVTPAGGTVTIIVGPGPVIAVRDEGPGLSVDRLAQLCHRHGRADHASSNGAGLGLAIVARIVAAHDARLETIPQVRRLQIVFNAASPA
jgi:two-component system OmpR family sensor kinase